jgi:hypothetical protein
MNQTAYTDALAAAISMAEQAARDRIASAASVAIRELQSTLRQFSLAEYDNTSSQLNAHFGRMRAFENDLDWCDALLDASTLFSRRSAFFSIRKDQLWYQGSRGITAESTPPPVDISAAAAFANAVSRRAAIRAARSATDLSSTIADFAGVSDDSGAELTPLLLPDRVPGVLYTEGASSLGALELIAALAAATLENHLALEEAAPGRHLRVRASAGSTAPRDAAARRFARVAVAGIVLHEFEALQRGRLQRSIYSMCAPSIDAARRQYRSDHSGLPDYLHQEIVGTLANNQPDLLGANYPHPR